MPQMQLPDVMIGTVVTAAYVQWLSAALAIGLGVAAAAAFRRLRGTTLAAPAVWAMIAALALAADAIAAAQADGRIDTLSHSLLHYAAAVGTFCPVMAVLGGKRPQDRGWQWIVLSLWVVLLAPAAQAVVGRSAQQLDLFTAWRLLLGVLIGMSLLNYLPTRHAVASAFYALGQSLLLWPYLAGGEPTSMLRLIGLGAMTLAAVITFYVHRAEGEKVQSTSAMYGFNRRWETFRDGWGAFWGLRVMQRVNQAADLSGWPVRLEWWNGFTEVAENASEEDSEVDRDTRQHIEQTLNSLLRRFERLEPSEEKRN
jgi:hypothetical protein